MKIAYYTRHTDAQMVENIFAHCIRRYWNQLEQSKQEQSDSMLFELVLEDSMTHVLEQTVDLMKSMPETQRIEVAAQSLLAHAAFFRAASEYYKTSLLEVLLPEEMARCIDLQAEHSELRGDESFFFVLSHIALGELCREQESGQHKLVLVNSTKKVQVIEINNGFFIQTLASEWSKIAASSDTSHTTEALTKLASLLCAIAGALFSRL